MGQKRRLRKLQRQARIARHDSGHSKQNAASRAGVHKSRAKVHVGTPMGEVPFGVQGMEKLLRDDPACRESIFLTNGVAIKVYDRRIWVVAPERMEDDPEFFEMLNDVMIEHFCGHDTFERVCRQQGYEAATRLLEDVISDVDFYDDGQ